MSKQLWREQAIASLAKEGIRLEDTKRLLRYAATLQRLAEAQCNGDWPADNGVRDVVTCLKCESRWVESSLVHGDCKDCRTTEKARAFAESLGLKPEFAGDPRGAVFMVTTPSGREVAL